MRIKKFVAGVMRTNCYLVYNEGANEAVLIDPARGFNKIKEFCDNEGLKVAAVLITHGHFDHILEASLWQSEGAKVYIHSKDADKLYSEKNLAYMVNAAVPPSRADILLEDGGELNIASLKIKVIHTPGHSPGAVCYIIEDALFSGDTLFHGDFGRTDFPDGNFEDLKLSLKKLFGLPGGYAVYPGHEEETTLAEERENNEILRYL